MNLNIVHVTSSPRYPQCNSHAGKAIQMIKSIYIKCSDIKMGFMLLKTTPIVSHDHKVPAETFFNRQLIANLPIFRSACRTGTPNWCEEPIMTSKYRNHDKVWCKVDPNTTWLPRQIVYILPNQSYIVKLKHNYEVRRNEHHLSGQHPISVNGAKSPENVKTSPAVQENIISYNLRFQVKQSAVKWAYYPIRFKQNRIVQHRQSIKFPICGHDV